MSIKPLVDQLNAHLASSPYLLPADEVGQNRAFYLLATCKRIHTHFTQVSTRFQHQSRAVQLELERIVAARSVYETNAIEFAGLDLRGTEQVLQQAPESIDRLREFVAKKVVEGDQHLIDVLGVQQANLFSQALVSDYAEHQRPILEIDLRELHKLTLPAAPYGGSYRRKEVTISGSSHKPAEWTDVPAAMHELVDWVSETTAPPALAAAVAHSWLAMIHPFEDGNGRMARLLANLVLMRAKWPPLVVAFSDRLQYLDALSASDEGGDILQVFDLFVKSIERSLSDLADPALFRRLHAADLQLVEEMRYSVWSHQIDQFLADLRSALGDKGLKMDRLLVPPASTFHRLEARILSGNTWLAKVSDGDRTDFLIWLGYSSVELEDTQFLNRPVPSLFVSERDRSPGAVHPYRPPWKGTPLPFDEIALVPDAGDPFYATLSRSGLTITSRPIEDLAAFVGDALGSAGGASSSQVPLRIKSIFHNVRVYDLADEMGVTNKDVIEAAKRVGVRIGSASSTMSPSQADRVRRELRGRK